LTRRNDGNDDAAVDQIADTVIRRCLLLSLLAMVLACCLAGGASAAATLSFSNPLRNGLSGKPLSCPDPSVIGADRGKWRYFLFCTSDTARNAFPIWKSEDLVHWYPNGFVFPYHRQPGWAVPSTGTDRTGLYWAPAMYRIENRWVFYFAAHYNPASGALGSAVLPVGTMVLGVATATSLAGPWHTKILHYPSQFNAVNAPAQQELSGGDIDPAVVRDPRSGQLYIFWAEQREQIWEGSLTSDGLTMAPQIRVAVSVSEPWECDPLSAKCTVEGPEPFYHQDKIYLMYSGASTWDSTYALGVASSPAALDPAQPFVNLPTPILKSGNGFLGPGGASAPVVGPGGESLILYHALLHPLTAHVSGARVLMIGTLNWVDGWPLIGNGTTS
jgi:arabinan endo-1,5-alpha-L-arabinosidase